MDYLNGSEKEYERPCPFCKSDHIGTLSPRENGRMNHEKVYAYCICCYAKTDNYESASS